MESPHDRIWDSAKARELHEENPHLTLWHGLRRQDARRPFCVNIHQQARAAWDERPECWRLLEVGAAPHDNVFAWVKMQGPLDTGQAEAVITMGCVVCVLMAGWAVSKALGGVT